MKIASFNINNVRRRLPNLVAWLRASEPDVVCLQELKTAQDAFPAAALEGEGYGALWRGEKSWNGVAILCKGGTPVLTRDALPGDASDAQSRYLEAAVNGVLIACLYLPNGNPAPGPKFDYKLRWLERLTARGAELVALPEPVVLAGDYNVIPEGVDVHDPAGWTRTPCSGRRRGRRTAICSPRGGRTRCVRSTPANRCTRSGTTCGTAGRATRACASTTF